MKHWKKCLILFILIVPALLVCAQNSNRIDTVSRADAVVSAMSLEQKIGQLIMTAVPGKQMTPYLETMIKTYRPGGVIFFGFNLSDAEGVKKFTDDIQKKSIEHSSLPVFISVDQEGGRVKRLTDGVTLFPGNMAAGTAGDKELAYMWGRILGLELRALGVNMNLTPALDVNDNPDNPVINTRSFGADVKTVSDMGLAYIKGQQESSCISVGKHFPGLGNSSVDTHLRLTVIDFDMKRLEEVELKPFQEAINNGLECIMTTHSAFPKILNNRDSATISPFFLTEVLRNRMKFNGLIITDDMEMGAITKELDIGSASVKAVAAGVDIVLLSTYGDSLKKIYTSLLAAVQKGDISVERINDSVKRIVAMKFKYGIAEYDQDDKVVCPVFSLSGDDAKITAKAEDINREISGKSICYRGDAALLSPKADVMRIFVSNTADFTKYLVLDDNDKLAADLSSAAALIKKIPASEKVILYVHSYSPKASFMTQLKAATGTRNIPLVLVLSGNPFPLLRAGGWDTVLMSFSNTPVSLEFLAKAASGELSAKRETKLLPDIK